MSHKRRDRSLIVCSDRFQSVQVYPKHKYHNSILQMLINHKVYCRLMCWTWRVIVTNWIDSMSAFFIALFATFLDEQNKHINSHYRFCYSDLTLVYTRWHCSNWIRQKNSMVKSQCESNNHRVSHMSHKLGGVLVYHFYLPTGVGSILVFKIRWKRSFLFSQIQIGKMPTLTIAFIYYYYLYKRKRLSSSCEIVFDVPFVYDKVSNIWRSRLKPTQS